MGMQQVPGGSQVGFGRADRLAYRAPWNPTVGENPIWV